MPEPLPPLGLTRDAVAAALSVSVATVDRMIKAGTLDTFQVGTRCVRITPESVDRVVAAANLNRKAGATGPITNPDALDAAATAVQNAQEAA